MREEVLKYRRVINRYLGRYGLLAGWEAEELEKAYSAVKRIQDRCFHQFKVGVLFTSRQLECEHCGFLKPQEEEEELDSAS